MALWKYIVNTFMINFIKIIIFKFWLPTIKTYRFFFESKIFKILIFSVRNIYILVVSKNSNERKTQMWTPTEPKLKPTMNFSLQTKKTPRSSIFPPTPEKKQPKQPPRRKNLSPGAGSKASLRVRRTAFTLIRNDIVMKMEKMNMPPSPYRCSVLRPVRSIKGKETSVMPTMMAPIPIVANLADSSVRPDDVNSDVE